MMVVRNIHNGIYKRKAFALARDAYASYCEIRVKPRDYGYAEVSVTVKPEFSGQGRQVIPEFWNYFLDASCQSHLSAE